MAYKTVRLADCNPSINPGWMTQERFQKEVAKIQDVKDLRNRRITIEIP